MLSPLKKRQKKNILSKAEKQILLNKYKMELQLNPETAVIDITEHTASATGVSQSCLRNLIHFSHKADFKYHACNEILLSQ